MSRHWESRVAVVVGHAYALWKMFLSLPWLLLAAWEAKVNGDLEAADRLILDSPAGRLAYRDEKP